MIFLSVVEGIEVVSEIVEDVVGSEEDVAASEEDVVETVAVAEEVAGTLEMTNLWAKKNKAQWNFSMNKKVSAS